MTHPAGGTHAAPAARRDRGAGVFRLPRHDVYAGGASEELVGRALAGRRDEVVLATKGHDPMGEGCNDRGSSRRWLRRAVDVSLRRLGTDRTDLYQLRRLDPSTDIEETIATLTDLQREGKIVDCGTLTFSAGALVEA